MRIFAVLAGALMLLLVGAIWLAPNLLDPSGRRAVTLPPAGTAPGHTEKRVALVIGNAAYRNVPRLMNPGNDAEDVGAKLRELDFQTVVATDLDRAGINEALARFSRAAADADIALVYYAGHGMQFAGTNYLLPVDARLDSAEDINRFRLVPVDDVLEALKGVRGARVLVLDACRNNPVEDDLKRRLAAAAGANRDAVLARGLKPPVSANGLLVAYATQANDVANDGVGRNSPFTAAFLKHAATPDLDIRQMFFRVQDEVDRLTAHRQKPELSVSPLGGEVKLKLAAAAPEPPRPPPSDPVREAWFAVRDTTSIAILEEFRRQYPGSVFDRFALARIAELRGVQAAVVVPPRPPVPPPDPCAGAVTASFPSRCAAAPTAAQERGLKPQDGFKECANCPEMVVVPAGSFLMGSPADEKERDGDEGPQHRVSFAKPFAVGRFAVTFDEWDACVAAGGCNEYKPGDQGWGHGRRPVINVSWDDAKAYVAWLSRATGNTYRLLSEAEREYVSRAGTTTPFWWGSSITTGQANYDGNYTYAGGSKGEYRQRTLPVDSFQPNPWGLYQVHGNVREWTEDCWHDSYAGAPSDGSAWTILGCSFRVLRGGAWFGTPGNLRSAPRDWDQPDYRNFNVGFRVARTLSPPTP